MAAGYETPICKPVPPAAIRFTERLVSLPVNMLTTKTAIPTRNISPPATSPRNALKRQSLRNRHFRAPQEHIVFLGAADRHLFCSVFPCRNLHKPWRGVQQPKEQNNRWRDGRSKNTGDFAVSSCLLSVY
jgi:hypothetical protein